MTVLEACHWAIRPLLYLIYKTRHPDTLSYRDLFGKRLSISALLVLNRSGICIALSLLDFLHPNGEYPEMKREDFWTVFLIVLAAALLWIVVHVFWGHNEHQRNLDLGIDQRAPVDSRGYRFGDAGAVDTRKDSFHQSGLALSIRTSSGESFLSSPMAQIRSAMGRGSPARLC